MNTSNSPKLGIPAALALFFPWLIGTSALAVEPIYTARFSDVAIKGYDAVAYFENGEPTAGKKGITHEWQGATWRFASEQHRDLFAANPEKYAPQYGGYCAYAVSQGSTAGINPKAWDIHEGKLYLNYSLGIQKKWRRDQAKYIADADEKWPAILAE
ncbi:MAG: YHS domain-containing (seleno)protein [Acidobacteriota bacterium]